MKKKLTFEKLANRVAKMYPMLGLTVDRNENKLYLQRISNLDSHYVPYIELILESDGTINLSDCCTGLESLKARINDYELDNHEALLKLAKSYKFTLNGDNSVTKNITYNSLQSVINDYFKYFEELSSLV